MYSSCVRAVAALAVHVAAVIMTELLVLRLVVTEAGRNPGPLPISRAKYKDLNSLSKFLRRAAQILYAGLLVDDTIEDSESDGIDVELDQVDSLSDKDGENE
jgi:hypothetical protein